MITAKKIFFPLLLFFIFVLLYTIKSYLDWGFYTRATIENIAPITRAYGKYVQTTGKRPESLEQIVKSGLLPEYSPYYNSFLKEGAVSEKAISYLECELTFDFSDTENPKIIIPKEHLKKLWISPNRKSHDIELKLNKLN